MPFFYFHPWKWIFSNAHDNSDRVWIKGITIRNLILLCWWYKTLCKTRINTHEFHLYCWNHVCKLNKQRLVDCFHQKFRCYTQITVHNYCIAICKEFPHYQKPLMALWTNFLWLKIQKPSKFKFSNWSVFKIIENSIYFDETIWNKPMKFHDWAWILKLYIYKLFT